MWVFFFTVFVLLKTIVKEGRKVRWYYLLFNFTKDQKYAVTAEGFKTSNAIRDLIL